MNDAEFKTLKEVYGCEIIDHKRKNAKYRITF